jgi:hypothetical protein
MSAHPSSEDNGVLRLPLDAPNALGVSGRGVWASENNGEAVLR